MPLNYDINGILAEANNKGFRIDFPDDLQKILEFSLNQNEINDPKELAYLLGTAKAESNYSLSRWEADYVCNSYGKPYQGQPCPAAMDYYKKVIIRNGRRIKNNYFNMGVDQNGLPYFGRGLIQLTGKGNYDKFGKIFNIDLLNNADLALEPGISFAIALKYLSTPQNYAKSTFYYVLNNQLTTARKTVNGGTNGLADVNKWYNEWLPIIKNNILPPGQQQNQQNQQNQNLIVAESPIKPLLIVGFLGILALLLKKLSE
jgi:predicted chitinase